MRSTIDAAGRIVIPRDIRAEAGLEPGTTVEVDVRDGVVTIEPAASVVRIVRKGRLRVAVPEEERETLTSAEVTAVREKARR